MFDLALADFLQFDFLMRALIGSILLSLATGLLSPLLVAKRYAFMGSAISHSTLLSLTITFGLFNPQGPIGVFLSLISITLLLNCFLAHTTYKEDVPADSMIGIFFTTTMALGIILQSLTNNGNNLMNYLFGNILLLESADVIILSILMTITGLAIVPFFKKWIYFTFDSEGAKVSGLNTKLLHYAFFLLVSLIIVSSVKLAGTVLINTLLIIPGVFAFKVAKSVKQVFIVSTLFCLISGIIGLVVANKFNLPTGATTTIIQFVGLLLATIMVKK
ncbi:iron chelate uptake ABC transporter, FeCT family, permease protein [Bacteriovorax sp. BSW11_IV]|uniref:metal ABC transporter permease n=1 Tax=Bacteriovorax sp. BSW11_IV TaxID=1353529 RepID=UPI000389DC92|nr:metal ABC transporter permease [Bacteriovorax sp. BSW11_IV]EQC46367.1 iron chelate uptake ABC transporter, FeCT family, permease protein [Bacteriovorax sp. BSW11_IV]